MEQAKIKELSLKSAEIKLGALEAVYSASSGHPGRLSFDLRHPCIPLF